MDDCETLLITNFNGEHLSGTECSRVLEERESYDFFAILIVYFIYMRSRSPARVSYVKMLCRSAYESKRGYVRWERS